MKPRRGVLFPVGDDDDLRLAPASLLAMSDAEALAWIQAAAADPAQSVIIEPFSSADPLDYPELLIGPTSPCEEECPTCFCDDGGGDLFLRLAGTPGAAVDLQTHDGCNPACDPGLCDPMVHATNRAHFALLFELEQRWKTALFADGSACGHLPCSPWHDQDRFVEHGDAAGGWHVLFLEYRLAPWPAVAFCLDGRRLAKGGMVEALEGDLARLLSGATPDLRLRVSANVEGNDDCQQVELDWFALQGSMQ